MRNTRASNRLPTRTHAHVQAIPAELAASHSKNRGLLIKNKKLDIFILEEDYSNNAGKILHERMDGLTVPWFDLILLEKLIDARYLRIKKLLSLIFSGEKAYFKTPYTDIRDTHARGQGFKNGGKEWRRQLKRRKAEYIALVIEPRESI